MQLSISTEWRKRIKTCWAFKIAVTEQHEFSGILWCFFHFSVLPRNSWHRTPHITHISDQPNLFSNMSFQGNPGVKHHAWLSHDCVVYPRFFGGMPPPKMQHTLYIGGSQCAVYSHWVTILNLLCLSC